MDAMCLKFETNDYDLNRTFRIALGEIYGNIYPFKDGLLEEEVPVILAGLGYDTPWTRDAAINTWNCGGLLYPEASKNTLLSVLEKSDGKVKIGGQYWDCIIWTIGAWWLYLYTGDKKFLKLSIEAVANSLKYFEETEFSEDLNLFRGPACYGDGISAYPDIYARINWCGIDEFPKIRPDLAAKVGHGNPMHSLSTNCLYYYAYVLAGCMSVELNEIPDRTWGKKAKALKEAINKHFWLEDKGFYRYLVDPFGGCEHQEGMGHSFAIMFGVADKEQAEKIFKNQYISNAGIPCVWPAFDRYISNYVKSYGRHSGTVWPHIQAFWAEAATIYGKQEIFSHEFQKLKEFALRDSSFYEIYHPDTGEPYGGLQEGLKNNSYPWIPSKCQTWCSTGFIHMVLMNIIGMKFEPKGIEFIPMMVKGVEYIELKYLKYRSMTLNVFIEGRGTRVIEFKINGKPTDSFYMESDALGEQNIYIKVTE